MTKYLVICAIVVLFGCDRETTRKVMKGPFPEVTIEQLKTNYSGYWIGKKVAVKGYIIWGECNEVVLVSRRDDLRDFRPDLGVRLLGYKVQLGDNGGVVLIDGAVRWEENTPLESYPFVLVNGEVVEDVEPNCQIRIINVVVINNKQTLHGRDGDDDLKTKDWRFDEGTGPYNPGDVRAR